MYKRQPSRTPIGLEACALFNGAGELTEAVAEFDAAQIELCLLYTSDAVDERSSVDLGGRRIIKKKNIDRAGEQTNHKHNVSTLER